MKNSLLPRRSSPPARRGEMLTRQFYDWEMRGRGWQLRDYPVGLEPPFRPVFFHDAPADPVVDDGRIPTFWSRLFGGGPPPRSSTDEPSEEEFLALVAEMDEPSACDYYEEDFRELGLILPREQKVSRPFVHQIVASASYCTHPIAFEVVGTASRTTVQMAATRRDLPQLRGQLAAHLPDARFPENEPGCSLERSWGGAGGRSQIIDFGLSDEFMIPLDAPASLELDPLVSIVGALAELEGGEVGVFQVIFQKARSDWAKEIMDAVRFADGTPVFSDAPEMIPHAKRKLSSPLYAAVIRVAAKAGNAERLWRIVRGVSSGMAQLAGAAGNELIPLSNDGYDPQHHEQALLRRLSFRCGMILNLDELVSLVHPPSHAVRSGKLVRADERSTKAAPALASGHPLVLGVNEHQNESSEVTLSNDQRTRHLHLIGSSGSGKSTLLLNLIRQDMEAGHGLCVIDPHGDLIDGAIARVPDSRIDDVILFDPSDSDYPVGFNILQAGSEPERAVLSSDLTATFRRMSTSWGDVMDAVLANAILAVVESGEGGTLFELKRFLVEKGFRDEFLRDVGDESIRYFWTHEFPLIASKPQGSILIRLDAFLRQKLIRNIVCQKETKLNFREIMDGRKILLVKLSQGLIGEENAHLLGTMLVSRLYQAALSRQDSENRPYFWLYMDEFHHFITPSMERILSGTRKYHLGLTLAHQEFRQVQSRSQEVASSVLSNCYTRICFRLGDADAEKFASGFSFFDAKALQNLGVGEAIARVERADHDFNLSVPRVPAVDNGTAERRKRAVTESSRIRFARDRSQVEAEANGSRQRPPVDETGKSPVAESSAPKNPSIGKRNAPPPPAPHAAAAASGHRYLQGLIKRIGEDHGFIATVEKPVFGGVGRIDVALEREDIRIACEVAGTNATEHEVQNIQKCLAAGVDRIVVVSADKRHLANVRNRAELVLSPPHLLRVHFLEPENFHLFLESIAVLLPPPHPLGNGEPERVKGYKIETSVKEGSPAEDAAKKGVIRDLIARVARRREGSRDG